MPFRTRNVSERAAHDQIRQARLKRGEDLETVARRAGVRPALLRAIENGRFDELPPGVYARHAIRSCAVAVGLAADDVVAACEPMLPAFEDPIAGLARLRGVRPPRPEPAVSSQQAAADVSWREAAAAAIDGGIIALMTAAIVEATALWCGVAASALGRGAAGGFGLVGLVLAGYYFVFFGGIARETPGERLLRVTPADPPHDHAIDLRSIAARALRCASRDLQMLRQLGALVGRQRGGPGAPEPTGAISPSAPDLSSPSIRASLASSTLRLR
jgi:transcriptional regulator with XRE-family HTH domain